MAFFVVGPRAARACSKDNEHFTAACHKTKTLNTFVKCYSNKTIRSAYPKSKELSIQIIQPSVILGFYHANRRVYSAILV